MWGHISALMSGQSAPHQLPGDTAMKKVLFVLPLLLVAASAAAQVTKSKTGTGFSGYENYRQLDVGPVQQVSNKGATGASDVPVYTAKSRGLKLRRMTGVRTGELGN